MLAETSSSLVRYTNITKKNMARKTKIEIVTTNREKLVATYLHKKGRVVVINFTSLAAMDEWLTRVADHNSNI